MAAKFDLIKRYGGEHILKTAAKADPQIVAEIRAELYEIRERWDGEPGRGIHADRCVVTFEYREALRRVVRDLE